MGNLPEHNHFGDCNAKEAGVFSTGIRFFEATGIVTDACGRKIGTGVYDKENKTLKITYDATP